MTLIFNKYLNYYLKNNNKKINKLKYLFIYIRRKKVRKT